MTNTHITIGGHKVSAGKVYSTSEVKTGDVWIDGKPIYSKVINCTYPTVADTSTQTPFNISNLGYIIAIEGNGRSGGGFLPINYRGGDYSLCYCTNTNVVLATNNTGLLGATARVILYYTKTTD